jgi:hypothetical protein
MAITSSSLQIVPRRNPSAWAGGAPFLLEVQETRPQTLAQVGYQVVASAFGAVLHKALNDHIDACPVCSQIPVRPLFDCPEAKELFYLLPAQDRILLA